MKNYGGITGAINLSAKDGSLYKRTLICHTGLFDAMYGPVEVTKEKLEQVAELYNKQHATVQNDADYAPILVDHLRAADLIKGRVMPDLEVGEWIDPGDGTEGWGLYCTLRVDDEDAKNKVEGVNGQNKKYAHVSMSFDDEGTYELFEVSFVAVEAARRAMVLSNGGKKMSTELQAKLSSMEKKHKTLLSSIKAAKAVRGAATLAAVENLAAAETEATGLAIAIAATITKLKTSALSAQLKGFIREGKLSKAEFDKLNVVEFAAMPASALKAILGSYAARPVSKDLFQHGQTGATSPVSATMSAAQMREAAKLQKTGKGAKLAEGDPKPEDKKPEDKEKEDSDSSLKYEDMEDAIKECEGLGAVVEKLKGNFKRMGDQLKKLSEPDADDKGDEGDAE